MIPSPREQFHQRTEDLKKFQELMGEPAMRAGITYALAELALAGSTTTEQLVGAKRFVDTFTKLGEIDGLQSLPQKPLKTLNNQRS